MLRAFWWLRVVPRALMFSLIFYVWLSSFGLGFKVPVGVRDKKVCTAEAKISLTPACRRPMNWEASHTSLLRFQWPSLSVRPGMAGYFSLNGMTTWLLCPKGDGNCSWSTACGSSVKSLSGSDGDGKLSPSAWLPDTVSWIQFKAGIEVYPRWRLRSRRPSQRKKDCISWVSQPQWVGVGYLIYQRSWVPLIFK